jgi:hypothetical protein
MMEACKLCGALIVAPEDAVLDAGRDARNYTVLAQRIGAHIQGHHADLFQALAPAFIEFQLLMYGFLLRDHQTEGEPPAWLKGRAALHGKLRAMLMLDNPVAVKYVKPAAAVGNGKGVV